tara:strand:+ start:2850 stop:3065 length:216 start_codon:yes stop_codon:yes gene_type:complete
MIHLIKGVGSNTEKIQIEENFTPNQDTVIISCSFIDDEGKYNEETVSLDIDKLHSFIGTLLHVQAKMKNRI